MDENNVIKLDTGDNESDKYKIEAISNNMINARELIGHLSGLYYLVFCKGYLEEKNT